MTPPSRVDVRVLHAGTMLRFVLLIALIATSTVFTLTTLVPMPTVNGHSRWSLCMLAAGGDPNPDINTSTIPTYQPEYFANCMSDHHDTVLVWTVVGCGSIIVLTLLTYWLLPVWRRRGTSPVDALGDRALVDELHALVAKAGIRRTPRFVVDPSTGTSGADVFGCWPRYTVRLHGGLIARRTTDPASYQAVVLHELAHIRNHDVDVTYLSVALWRGFVLALLLPVLVLTLLPTLGQGPFAESFDVWRDHWQLGLRQFVRMAVLTALIYLTRADILRMREVYADLDAVRWGAETRAWHQKDPPASKSRPLQAFLRLWRTHPTWTDRRHALNEPSILFGASALPMFLTGVTALLVAGTVQVNPWPTAVLVTGITGVTLWRAVVYAVLNNRVTPSGLKAGFWLGVGFAVGELLTFRTAGLGLVPTRPEFLLGLVVAAIALCWWVTQCAELWIRTSRGRSVRLTLVVGLLATCIVFGVWFDYWMSWIFLVAQTAPDVSQVLESIQTPSGPPTTAERALWASTLERWPDLVISLGSRPMLFLGATVLWLYPLFALTRTPNRDPVPWMRFVRSTTSDPTPYTATPPAMRHITATITLAGALCLSSVLITMFLLHRHQPAPGQRDAIWAATYFFWVLVALIVGGAITTICVTATARRYPMVIALLTATGAMAIGLVGVFILASFDGCIPSTSIMTNSCSWRPRGGWAVISPIIPFAFGLGVYVMATVALAGSALGTAARRVFRNSSPLGQTRNRPPRTYARRIAVAGACVAVGGLAVNTATQFWRQPEITYSADPVRPTDITRLQVQAWSTLGGGTLVYVLKTQLETSGLLANYVAQKAIADGRSTAIGDDIATFRPLCSAIRRTASSASEFLPVPDAATQQHWYQLFSRAKSGALHCLQALTLNMGPLFERSLSELVNAYRALSAMIQRVSIL